MININTIVWTSHFVVKISLTYKIAFLIIQRKQILIKKLMHSRQ